jgi:hypothetical protein
MGAEWFLMVLWVAIIAFILLAIKFIDRNK